jgi:hypothetical protein
MAVMVYIRIWRENVQRRGQFCPDENINISQICGTDSPGDKFNRQAGKIIIAPTGAAKGV